MLTYKTTREAIAAAIKLFTINQCKTGRHVRTCEHRNVKPVIAK